MVCIEYRFSNCKYARKALSGVYRVCEIIATLKIIKKDPAFKARNEYKLVLKKVKKPQQRGFKNI
jgi:hypothetical protein